MKITIVGAGSLGSFTALLLAKMAKGLNWSLRLCDFDKVETHNQRNQLFKRADVGRSKVEALKDLLEIISDVDISISTGRITAESELDGIVIALVDSMKSRKEIFEAVKYCANVPLLVEARSGGDVAVIYAFDPRDPDNVKIYESTLHSDAEAVPAPCADPQTVDIIFEIAALIGKLLSLHSKGKLRGFFEVLINFEDLPSISVNGKIADVRKIFESQ